MRATNRRTIGSTTSTVGKAMIHDVIQAIGQRARNSAPGPNASSVEIEALEVDA